MTIEVDFINDSAVASTGYTYTHSVLFTFPSESLYIEHSSIGPAAVMHSEDHSVVCVDQGRPRCGSVRRAEDQRVYTVYRGLRGGIWRQCGFD